MAVPGALLLTVEDTSSFILEVHLDEQLTGKVTSGTPVDISVDAINRGAKRNNHRDCPSL